MKEWEKELERISNPVEALKFMQESIEIDKILKKVLSKKEFNRVEKHLKEALRRSILTGYVCKELKDIETLTKHDVISEQTAVRKDE